MVTLSPTVSTCDHTPVEPILRSIANPVSLFALSIQLRLIWCVDTALADRLLGAIGIIEAVYV